MKLLVQKYGGTSVATAASRDIVCENIITAREGGANVVVVVSAMGRRGEPYATDTLLSLFADGSDLPKSREQDALFACGEIISGTLISNMLRKKGIDSIFLTGGQAGIVTDNRYSDARIITVRRQNLGKWLDKGFVVIVAGGQGITADGDFTSLGRGGSDTSCTAIAYYLDADEVQIYTDVAGIYTADPRLVPSAIPIPFMSYDHCRKLAAYGAKVIHPRAVAYAERGKRNVLSVKSTFSREEGTKIGDYQDHSISIVSTRNQLYLHVPEDNWKELEQRLVQADAEILFHSCQEGTVHVCLDVKYKNLPFIPNDTAIKDLVFVIGTDCRDKFSNAISFNKLTNIVHFISGDCAVVMTNTAKHESIVNQLHDSLCMGGK